jgi:hypothetical protein
LDCILADTYVGVCKLRCLSLFVKGKTPMTSNLKTKPDILEGYLDIEPFAHSVDRHPRSVRRWTNEPDGLPCVKIGSRVLIHVESARAWIFGRLQTPNPTRQR